MVAKSPGQIVNVSVTFSSTVKPGSVVLVQAAVGSSKGQVQVLMTGAAQYSAVVDVAAPLIAGSYPIDVSLYNALTMVPLANGRAQEQVSVGGSPVAVGRFHIGDSVRADLGKNQNGVEVIVNLTLSDGRYLLTAADGLTLPPGTGGARADPRGSYPGWYYFCTLGAPAGFTYAYWVYDSFVSPG